MALPSPVFRVVQPRSADCGGRVNPDEPIRSLSTEGSSGETARDPAVPGNGSGIKREAEEWEAETDTGRRFEYIATGKEETAGERGDGRSTGD